MRGSRDGFVETLVLLYSHPLVVADPGTLLSWTSGDTQPQEKAPATDIAGVGR